MKKLFAILLAVSLCIGAVACGTTQGATVTTQATTTDEEAAATETSSIDDTSAEPIYIAVICPLTGDNQQYGEAFRKAITMALDEINGAGGVNGSEIICEYFDDKADQAEAVICAQKVVAADKYFMVIGSQPSGCSMAIAPIIKDAGMIQVSPISSHPDYTSLSENAFTLNYTMQYCGPTWGDYIVQWYGSRRPAIIYSNDDYGVSVYNYTSERLAEYNLEYVCAETYVTGSVKDFTSMLSKVKDSGADLLCIRGPYADTAQCVIQARQLDLDIPISIDGQSANDEFLQITGADSEGCTYVDTMFLSNTEEPFYSFAQKYNELYGEMADNYNTQAYDTINIIADALKECGTDTQGVHDYIANLHDYVGVSGIINMLPNRTRDCVFYVIEIQDGKFVKVDEIASMGDDYVCPDLSEEAKQ